MSPKAGYGRSRVERPMVALLRLVPGSSPANGFAAENDSNVLLASIAAVRELSVFRYLPGITLMLRLISMSYP